MYSGIAGYFLRFKHNFHKKKNKGKSKTDIILRFINKI